ncbi:MAG: hypothetical protein HYY54_01865 [candidate division NC10 bacterium]|nr:hypothetical protein [candidate division NC10 bacterium]
MGKQRRSPAQSRGRAWRSWSLGVLAALVAGGLVLAWRAPAPVPPPPPGGPGLSAITVEPAVARRETRPTLDPALFVGKAALAHRVAREIPDTLDQLYCYCGCDKHLGHKSLLSCYTDGHAAT